MKITLQEFAHNYRKYLFGYTLHAEREENDSVDDLYEKGFLPFTGNIAIENTYYMARSCRVDLEKFSVSSENRRVQKKIASQNFITSKHTAEHYINDDTFIKFCLEYFTKRHGSGIFSRERLQFVLLFSKEVYVIKYTDEQGNVIAYVIEVAGKIASQYWFSFYDIKAALPSLGMWLMLDCTITAKENELKYYYLGTVFGEKALYKTNFNALEYWNGNAWIQNIANLKGLARHDKEHEI
jgi:arginine-tRNA-protein transferase